MKNKNGGEFKKSNIMENRNKSAGSKDGDIYIYIVSINWLQVLKMELNKWGLRFFLFFFQLMRCTLG